MSGDVKKQKEKTQVKKVTAIIAEFVLLVSAFSISASADGLEEFNDFFNAEGTYSYYFDQGLTVVMPEEWYRSTIVRAYKDRAIFCHKDSYNKWAEKGIENGGRLFSLSYSVNSDFKDLDEMTYIGFDEETALNYYVTKPTDYQAYGSDPEIRAEYDRLFRTADEVIANIKILSADIPADSILTYNGDEGSAKLIACFESGNMPEEVSFLYDQMGANPEITTRDADTIRDVYDLLKKVEVTGETQMSITDSYHHIRFKLAEDLSVFYSFEGSDIWCCGGKNYSLSNSRELFAAMQKLTNESR